jgi:hypothetical protein
LTGSPDFEVDFSIIAYSNECKNYPIVIYTANL